MSNSSIWAPQGEQGPPGPPGPPGPTGASGGNVPTVESYAALRAVALPVGTQTVFVAGRNSAGDGGGGRYSFVPGDSTSVDNNGMMIVSSDGKRWKYITHSLTSNNLYEEYGEVTDRFADRSFFGGAVKNDGRNNIAQEDWLSKYQILKGRTAGFIQNSQVAMLSGEAGGFQNAANTLIVGAQTANLYDNYNAIALVGIAVANKQTGNGYAYAGYLEAYREVGVAGGAYGLEVDTINFASLQNTDPYRQSAGQAIGLQVASGGEYDPAGQFDSSAALNIQRNGSRYYRGIVFGHDSLTGADEANGSGVAIAFGKNHRMQWFASGGAGNDGIQTSSIRSTNSTVAGSISQEFGENYVSWAGVNGAVFAIESNPNTANYFSVRGQAPGLPIQLLARGQDTNIDLQLVPKGTGGVRLGDYTAGALSPSGYITVKDSGGTTRRLLVG